MSHVNHVKRRTRRFAPDCLCASLTGGALFCYRAETVSDFLHKIGIVLKEADETNFWLGLVLSINPEIEDGKRLCDESLELMKIFQSVKTKTRAYLRGKGELS